MVISNDKSICVEAVHEILFHEFGRAQLAEIPGKGDYIDIVNAEAVDEFLLLFQSVEQAESGGVLLKDVARMRPECDDRALLAFLPGRILQHLKYGPVSGVHPVEETCSGYNHLTSSRS